MTFIHYEHIKYEIYYFHKTHCIHEFFFLFTASSAHAGDLALQPIEYNDTSDDELTSEETASLGGHSLASSGSGGRYAMDQVGYLHF